MLSAVTELLVEAVAFGDVDGEDKTGVAALEEDVVLGELDGEGGAVLAEVTRAIGRAGGLRRLRDFGEAGSFDDGGLSDGERMGGSRAIAGARERCSTNMERNSSWV